MGNAMVMTQYIRLTPDMQSKQGALWNRVVRISSSSLDDLESCSRFQQQTVPVSPHVASLL